MDSPKIACRRCGRIVSAEAPHCPECRADPRTGLSSYRGGERDRVRVCEGVGIRCVAFAVDFVILSAVEKLKIVASDVVAPAKLVYFYKL